MRTPFTSSILPVFSLIFWTACPLLLTGQINISGTDTSIYDPFNPPLNPNPQFEILSTDNIFLPEVFTPNRDGFNDTSQISWTDSVNPSDYRIKIFNQSHQLVGSFSSPTTRWSGDKLPAGRFWWVLLGKEDSIIQNGGLTIRR